MSIVFTRRGFCDVPPFCSLGWLDGPYNNYWCVVTFFKCERTTDETWEGSPYNEITVTVKEGVKLFFKNLKNVVFEGTVHSRDEK